MFRRKARATLATLSMLAAAGLVLAACGSDNGSAEGNTPDADVTPAEGGTMTIIYTSDPPSLDPAVAYFNPASSGNYLPALFGQLVQVQEDGEIVPDLALSVTSDDMTTWTIELRPDVTFSDGTPLDADVVEFNFDRYQKESSSQTYPAASHFEEVEVVDDLTVSVELDAPNGQFPSLLMSSLGMMNSPAAVQKWGDDYGQHPVGAGPFTLKEHVPGDHVTYEKNPDYWDAPKPYLDEVVWRVIADGEQGAQAFEAGEGDLWTGDNPKLLDRLTSEGYASTTVPQIAGQAFVLNTRGGATGDVRLRQALAWATDLDDFNEKVLSGTGNMSKTIFLEDSPLYTDVQNPVGDLEKGQELMAEYVAENGPATVAISYSATGDWPAAAEVLQQQWSRLDGLTVTTDPVSFSLFTQKLAQRDFDVILSGAFGTDPTWDLVNRWSVGSPLNYSGVDDQKIDEYFAEGAATTDVEERKAAYENLQKEFYSQMPQILLYHSGTNIVAQDDVAGLELYGPGYLKLQDVGFAP